MVEKLALRFGTVPDQSILRLNEFFSRQVQELAPEIQFLDKDLLSLVLKMNLSSQGEFKKYTAFIDVALDYISIFAPILGRDVYREALEEFIQNDDLFLKNYGDIYGFLTSVWDNLLQTKQVLPAWSLGWLFLNLPELEKQNKTLYIVGYKNLKDIEKEFFSELAHAWTIVDLEFESDFLHVNPPSEFASTQVQVDALAQVQTENRNAIVKVVSPIDEIKVCLQIYKKSLDSQSINIVAPKTKWFYKDILEIFFESEFKSTATDEESFREQVNAFLSPLRLQEGSFEQSDVQRIWSDEKDKFKNEVEFQRATSELFDSQKLLELNEHLRSFMVPETAIGFLTFLDVTLSSHKDPDRFSKVLRKLYPIALQIPKNIKMDVSSWLQFVSLKLDKVSPELRSQKINFYTLEEARWVQGETNIFLSCTRQDYDKSLFAYLSDYEVEKIYSDLGFNLEGMSPMKAFEEALRTHAHKGLTNYFMVPEFDFIGTSQQPSQIIQNLEKQGARVQSLNDLEVQNPKVVDTRREVNLCKMTSFKLKSLSASSLEMYIERPYEYFLSYVLGIKDEDPLGVDPSPKHSGIVFHEILAKFLDQKNITKETIQSLIEEKSKDEYQYWSNTKAVELQIARYAEDICTYIEADRERKNRTGAKTIGLEKKFEAYFDLKDLRFYKEHDEGRIKFRGTIDRVDECEGSLYILDYKSGKADSLPSNVVSSPEVQMPLYAMIVQDGILDLPGELAGLLYVSIKSQFKEVPALILKGQDEKYLERKLHHQVKASVTEEKFTQIIEEYRVYFKKIITDIMDNKFGSWVKDRDGNLYQINVDF
ncbi:MAG: PD-(D/E)XK nuclease family protein [Bdellovibrionaceae bacterium]|nr:PD-(D/E)XK nuclease family protein [Pseudobdellovibrionaceae bacterium]